MCCHEHIGGDTPAIAQKECRCIVGFPVERKFFEIGDTVSSSYVVIRAHSGDCPRSDELVRFGN
ncbi:hypothetical protein LCGC14_2708260 [marine sediment metagenome]|uniref:Uncharacterized protein n=1 Tax=marine sediment metagenome TaxID=412755 RepID=A0A0F8ZDV0_9ZZZZ